jgi:hypothetical protein
LLHRDFDIFLTDVFRRLDDILPPLQSSPTCESVTANDDWVSTPRDTPVLKDVLYNDVPVAPEMGLTITKLPYDGSNGVCTIVGVGVGLMYVPNSDFFGIDTCVYEACDEEERCDTATLTIVVVPSDDEPVANDDAVTTQKNTNVPINPLVNDEEVSGYELKVTKITVDGSSGTCVVESDTVVMYIPDTDFVGVDTCVYEACDERMKCDTATIMITVEGEKSEPCDDNEVVDTLTTTKSVRRDFD